MDRLRQTARPDRFIGQIFSMTYAEALVLCNDSWVHAAGGIPMSSFLLAHAEDLDDFYVLRVIGTCTLPSDQDMVRMKAQVAQSRAREIDPASRAHMQFGGLKCRILGSFYEGRGQLRLGADTETFSFSTTAPVYKPTPEALETIVNFIAPEVRASMEEKAALAGFPAAPAPIRIGKIRYTSSNRRQEAEPATPVYIAPSDFLGRRTAIFGMTRTGKSNTVKTIISAVAKAAEQNRTTIGQIVFDINGEYANANVQDDKSSIWNVFQDSCVRYRALDTPGFSDLRVNFYTDAQEGLMLLSRLSENDPYRDQTDLLQFLESSLAKPDERDDHGTFNRWRLRKAVYQCILYEAGYAPPEEFKIDFSLKGDLAAMVLGEAQIDGTAVTKLGKSSYQMGLDAGVAFFLKLKEMHAANQGSPLFASSGSGKSVIDPTLRAYLNVLARKNDTGSDIRGWRAIQPYAEYHSPARAEKVAHEIYGHLEKGRIVILDLSVGPYEVRTVLAKRLASHIFHASHRTLVAGLCPPHVVLYVEEAHNLVGKKDELYDVWPRIAKEGAKANLAFIYATQEPSSVHPSILANTENWFVTHLNNEDELRSLDKFYDFSDFHASLKTAQDVGFARLKTLSSPFVMPVQIDKFEPMKLGASTATASLPIGDDLLDIFG